MMFFFSLLVYFHVSFTFYDGLSRIESNTHKTYPVHMSTTLVVALESFSTGGGVVLPYMGYIGMCGSKGYGFQPFGHK